MVLNETLRFDIKGLLKADLICGGKRCKAGRSKYQDRSEPGQLCFQAVLRASERGLISRERFHCIQFHPADHLYCYPPS